MSIDSSDVIDRLLARRRQPDHPVQSVFAGVGMFTVERPMDVAGLGRVSWVAQSIDAFNWAGGGGIIRQAESAEQLRAALGYGYEGMREGALVTNLAPAVFADGWPGGWTFMPECYWNADGGRGDIGRSVPNMIYEARQLLGERFATTPVVPVIGCYDASGENPGTGVRLTVPDYLPDIHWAMQTYPNVVGYAVWRVETLDPADRQALA